MRSELISHSELIRVLSYDPATGLFTSKVNRQRVRVGDILGTPNVRGYIRLTIHLKFYFAHRLAWFYVNKVWPSDSIDHINGDKSDNRIINLRECDCVENGMNRKVDVRSKTGVTGVCLVTKTGKYMAHIKLDSGRKYLGFHDTIESAISARKIAESLYFGEFSRK